MMKRFRFRLQPLLELRQRREREQRRVVAERARDVRRSQDELSRLQDAERGMLRRARTTRCHAGLDVELELQGERWRLHLKRRIRERAAQGAEREALLAEARSELSRRSKDLKVIEQLRARRLDDHRIAVQRESRSEADEAATQMYLTRRQRAGGFHPAGAGHGGGHD